MEEASEMPVGAKDGIAVLTMNRQRKLMGKEYN